MTPEERLVAIRAASADRGEVRAELARTREHGLVRRHAAKLRRNRDRTRTNVPGYGVCAACGAPAFVDPRMGGLEPIVLCGRCAGNPTAVVLSGPDDPRLLRITNAKEP
jgi:hypothetical protein